VFNRVFGPTYAQKVGDFVEISSRLNRDPSNVSFRGETIPKTPIEEATGIPPEMILSRFNNPVSGKFYAMTSLFSKWWAGSVAKSTEEKLKNLLLNPADAQKVFAAIPDKQGAFDVKKINAAVDAGKRYGLNWVEDAIADISSGAARGAIRAGTSEAPVPVVEPDYMEE
jgi:hypothetical protein